ncbi:MAG: hypothetical protein N2376_07240 [Clostridia bacterium]|nr:hypothetical protein [Clostridia bacterium]
MKYHFTTVVSQEHLFKLMGLVVSLKKVCLDYKLFVLCANEIVYHILKSMPFPEVVPVMLNEVEDEALLRAKTDRIFHAYCWTLKPVFLYHVMVKHPDCEYFAHLDADLFFFKSPDAIFNENPEANLFLTHHRNSREFLKYYGLTGVFNTGFVGCKNTGVALRAVEKWKYQTVVYCPIKEDPIRKLFGDQRYVESWNEEYPGVHVVQSIGANTALWNITNYRVTAQEDGIYLDDTPLIFYHFSGLTIISRTEFNLNWYYHIDDEMVLEHIYKPYLEILAKAMKELNHYFPWFIAGFLPREHTPNTHYYSIQENAI